jgi:DNA-directed RNA polymerase subunit RPC12/RpoP
MGRKNPTNICPRCKVQERLPHGWCRSCINQQKRENQHRYNLKAKYGISVEELEEMKRKQDFKCASCGDEFVPGVKINVDHCHTSGTVRGILCPACNWALGLMKEDPDRIRALAAYADLIRKT